ncbi:MAG: pyridoxal-dependent decarboxylase [Crocinitomicaceae bacterium]|nr:pyridoxal-dependent decarboxylase [Crocinitomicaceae bacterium]
MKACSKPNIPHHWSNFYTVHAFRGSGDEMVERLAHYLAESQGKQRDFVLPYSTPFERLSYWKSRLNNSVGAKSGALWKANFLEEVLAQSNRLHDPRYLGHQVAVPLPQLSWLQAATSLLNNGMAIDEMGPASSPMEEAVMQELAQFMGLGSAASGILCHGGTLANLTALLAARQRKASGNPWKDGSERPCAVLVSEQAHYCVDRAVRVMGWGAAGAVKVRTLANHQIDPVALRIAFAESTARGLDVIAVVGNACTTSTGTFDDLEVLAGFADENDLWFHVDGAHGAAQIFSERNKGPLKGIEKADSVAMDFHKMLGVPALCTGLFYRNGSDAYAAFSQEAAYLYENEQEEWWNLSKRTFECTKRMLSVAVFGIWEAHSHNLWESLVDRLVDRAQVAARAIEQRPHWELFAHPQSNIVCFRLRGSDNAALRHAMLKHGPQYIVKTVLNGETWLRCTFQNPLTEESDIEALLDRLEELKANRG